MPTISFLREYVVTVIIYDAATVVLHPGWWSFPSTYITTVSCRFAYYVDVVESTRSRGAFAIVLSRWLTHGKHMIQLFLSSTTAGTWLWYFISQYWLIHTRTYIFRCDKCAGHWQSYIEVPHKWYLAAHCLLFVTRISYLKPVMTTTSSNVYSNR